ncbi:MAG: ATP-binding protein, partial [Candidatus Aenigmarchaeota archaeon]|nr:ATP-binding protein [Candidatus Aenigmarchaeota archaeon]
METIIGRDAKDKEIYGARGAVTIGKSLVGEGDDTHLTTPVMLDVVKPHVITICGKRGEGKSYTMGIIAEGLQNAPTEIKERVCTVIIDTQGIFWTMKTPNEKEATLLHEWGETVRGFPAFVYVPEAQAKAFSAAGVEYDGVFSLAPQELTQEDWLATFNLSPVSSLGSLLQSVMGKMSGAFDIDGAIRALPEESGFGEEKNVLRGMLESAKAWGIFGNAGMPPLLVPGKLSVLDFSLTSQNVRSLLVAVIARKIFAERTAARRREEIGEMEFSEGARVPLPWILIDEAHNFLPAEGGSPSSDILGKIVKEGRQPGISLVLATQRPMKLHPDALSQCDVVLSHRLTAENDVDSLKSIMQTYVLFDIAKYINELPKLKGSAIILDDNSE